MVNITCQQTHNTMETASNKVEDGANGCVCMSQKRTQQTHEAMRTGSDKASESQSKNQRSTDGIPKDVLTQKGEPQQQTQDEDEAAKDKDSGERVWEGIPEQFWPKCDW